MIRHWLDTEQEVRTISHKINTETDLDVVTYLQSLKPGVLSSVACHMTKAGDTILHLAAVRQRLSSVRLLLDNETDVNSRDGHGRSPLHACLYHNCLSSARLLITCGADVNEVVCRRTRESLLHRMIKGNRSLAVQLLVDMGAALEAVTTDGDTPLHFAARYNRLQVAQLLSVKGTDTNAANSKQEMPLHVAIASRNLDVAKCLVKNKACVTAKDGQGMTPLHLAVVAGSLDLVRMILSSNSTQVNGRESVLGRTPILLACSGSSPKIVSLLLSYGADVNLTTHYRKSVLHEAATSGTSNVLLTIMRRIVNPNPLATQNKTPLHCAVAAGRPSISRVLLNAGVNINMKDTEGNTALHIAAQDGSNDIISILLQHGSHVNLTNMQQQTALHLASMAGHASTCCMLIQAGCDPHLTDLHQASPQHYFDKFTHGSGAAVDTAAGITVRGTHVHFDDHKHLQGLSESNVRDNLRQSVDAKGNNMLHHKNNRSDGNKQLSVLGPTVAQMALANARE